jgi:hypothetical protein
VASYQLDSCALRQNESQRSYGLQKERLLTGHLITAQSPHHVCILLPYSWHVRYAQACYRLHHHVHSCLHGCCLCCVPLHACLASSLTQTRSFAASALSSLIH